MLDGLRYLAELHRFSPVVQALGNDVVASLVGFYLGPGLALGPRAYLRPGMPYFL